MAFVILSVFVILGLFLAFHPFPVFWEIIRTFNEAPINRSKLLEKFLSEEPVLQKKEISYLRKLLPELTTNFNTDFCLNETCRLFLAVFRELPAEKQKQFKVNKDVMRLCISQIRKAYQLKPDVFVDLGKIQEKTTPEILDLIEEKSRFIRKLNDREEEILFTRDPERWRRIYEELTENFDPDKSDFFYEQICRLGDFNKNVRLSDARNLFFKSLSFVVKTNKSLALKLYLQYIYIDNKTYTFKHKPIGKQNSEKLFKDPQQKKRFREICAQLKKDRNITKALEDAEYFYRPPRRKISLNSHSIQDAKTKQEETAKLLEYYLSEDELPHNISQKTTDFIEKNTMEDYQKSFFQLFITHSFHLNSQEVDIFAQSKGLFRDSFIESINEQYYDQLDDLLIEKEDEEYILNKDYYEQITNG